MPFVDNLKRVRYSTRNFLGSSQYLYPLVSLNPKLKDWMVNPHKNICIEGFPRSGNSFVYQAFQLFNPTADVAHHVHVPMQVIKSIKLNIPAVVIVRNPLHSTGSSILSHSYLNANLILRNYINFYKNLLPFRKEFVTVSFENATKRFPDLINSVNQKYGTNFLSKVITEEYHREIFLRIEEQHKINHQPQHMIALPTKEKEELKADVYKNIKKSSLMADAQKIYDTFLEITN